MTSADAIRAARAAINDAIARRDAEGIGAWLLEDYHVVTARSVQRNGRDESVKSWAAMFELDPQSSFVRTPEEIHVDEVWGMAQEHGRWVGVAMSGVYSAKWHRTEEGWRLVAEVFTAVAHHA